MRLAHDGPSRFARLIFTVCMAAAWSGALHFASAENAPPVRRALALEEFNRGMRAIQDAERDAPRDTFDLSAIVTARGRDAARLFQWVRDQTVWVPYRGCLRGEVGVLMDRIGNSLDR